MQIFQLISSIIGCASAAFALAVGIIKPFRRRIIDSFVHKSQYTAISKNIDEMNEKMDKMLTNDAQISTRLTRVEENVLENEADRLRSELFDCGNRCRRGIRLHPEEMDHIRAVFTKYSSKLKQNGAGEAEYLFICDYYNRQDFPQYHKQN